MEDAQAVSKTRWQDSDWNFIPQRYMVTFMILVGLFNVYTLRNTLSVAIVSMREKNVIPNFEWDASNENLILTMFYPTYIITNVLGGSLGERFGSKLVFGLGILLTSLITIALPFAATHSYAALIAVRLLQGVFEGFALPAAYTTFGKWFPKSERSMLRTISESGFDLGYLIGNPITGVLCNYNFLGGWPLVFYIFGGIGTIWFVLWWLLMYETPKDNPWISKKELDYITQDQADEVARQKVRTPWCSVLTSIPLWSMIIGSIISGFFVQFVRQDYPSYLKQVYGFDIKEIGWLTMLPYLIYIVTSYACGLLGDFVIRRQPAKRRTLIRKSFNFVSMLLTAGSQLGVIFVGESPMAVVWLMALSYGLNGVDAPGSGSALIDMTPVFAGSVFGFINGISNTVSIIGPLVTGLVTKDRESDRTVWNILFMVAVVGNVVSTVIFMIWGSSDLQSWGLQGESEPISTIPMRNMTPSSPDVVPQPIASNCEADKLGLRSGRPGYYGSIADKD